MTSKNYIYIIILLVISNVCYSQTYIFSQKEEAIHYTNSQGEKKYKTTSTVKGTYKIKFDLGDGGRTQLFTVYNNGVEDEWFGILEKLGNIEMQGTIFSKSNYAATKSNEIVTVLLAIDQTSMIIIFPDKLVEYSK